MGTNFEDMNGSTMGQRGLDSSGSEQGKWQAVVCGHGGEPLCSMKCDTFIDQLRGYQPFKDSLPENWLVRLMVGYLVILFVYPSFGQVAGWLIGWLIG